MRKTENAGAVAGAYQRHLRPRGKRVANKATRKAAKAAIAAG